MPKRYTRNQRLIKERDKTIRMLYARGFVMEELAIIFNIGKSRIGVIVKRSAANQ